MIGLGIALVAAAAFAFVYERIYRRMMEVVRDDPWEGKRRARAERVAGGTWLNPGRKGAVERLRFQDDPAYGRRMITFARRLWIGLLAAGLGVLLTALLV